MWGGQRKDNRELHTKGAPGRRKHGVSGADAVRLHSNLATLQQTLTGYV